ncbi:MAG: 50S ribosomal protein L11 methyltransferase [Bacteroides sp.]|nr:50S ribosomal protein L11 methyltransferase [Bacteroides sp.]MCM1414203.1 50S ribosomal protein L11 methyltransferase [Bacteroides sp.]MCM1472025.1 50S ribosomal protein L11 methyltransferase [Bacteroides sp.]
MNNYIEVRIDLDPCNADMTDVLAALLADAGFESFVPDDRGLTAYIKETDYDESMRQIPEAMPFATNVVWQSSIVEGKDWNHEWEKNYFKPIVVGDEVVIHSSFHKDVPECKYDIVIDPKMAFGTGHHQTTWLMIKSILQQDLSGKNVIDMGTGTGILAILATMRGAAEVVGIEIDEPAYVNAIENCGLNKVDHIRLFNGDARQLSGREKSADVFLANINRNVITGDMMHYARSLRPGGRMILSGFYLDDVDVVEKAAAQYGLAHELVMDRDNWACVHLRKK